MRNDFGVLRGNLGVLVKSSVIVSDVSGGCKLTCEQFNKKSNKHNNCKHSNNTKVKKGFKGIRETMEVEEDSQEV